MIKTVAIVDDEEEMEDIYSLILAPLLERGIIRMKFFSDARDFLEWFDHNPVPELLLCDINMPYLDGPELCRLLRKSGQSIQISFVSGHSAEDFQEQMSSLGISRFISKPLSSAEVVAVCENELGLLPVNQ